MSAALQALQCGNCQAPVPLVDAETVLCAHCGGTVAIPVAHREALRLAQSTAAARAAAEPLWAKLSSPVSPRTATVALALVVFLPVIVSGLAVWLPDPPIGRAQIYALFTLPALLPGAFLYLWAEAINATTLRFRDAMSAVAPRRGTLAPSCRNCGATLQLPEEAVAVTCPYCSTDNLVTHVPRDAIHHRLRTTLRTLAQATRKLRSRRLVISLGAIGLCGVVLGASALLWIATH